MRGGEDQGTSPPGYGPMDRRARDSDKRGSDKPGPAKVGDFGLLGSTDGYSCLNRLVEPEARGWQSDNPAYSRFAIVLSFAFITVMIILVTVKNGAA